MEAVNGKSIGQRMRKGERFSSREILKTGIALSGILCYLPCTEPAGFLPGSEAGKYPHPRGWQSGDSGSGMSVEPGAGLVGSGKPKLQRSGAVRAGGDSRGRE